MWLTTKINCPKRRLWFYRNPWSPGYKRLESLPNVCLKGMKIMRQEKLTYFVSAQITHRYEKLLKKSALLLPAIITTSKEANREKISNTKLLRNTTRKTKHLLQFLAVLLPWKEVKKTWKPWPKSISDLKSNTWLNLEALTGLTFWHLKMMVVAAAFSKPTKTLGNWSRYFLASLRPGNLIVLRAQFLF